MATMEGPFQLSSRCWSARLDPTISHEPIEHTSSTPTMRAHSATSVSPAPALALLTLRASVARSRRSSTRPSVADLMADSASSLPEAALPHRHLQPPSTRAYSWGAAHNDQVCANVAARSLAGLTESLPVCLTGLCSPPPSSMTAILDSIRTWALRSIYMTKCTVACMA